MVKGLLSTNGVISINCNYGFSVQTGACRLTLETNGLQEAALIGNLLKDYRFLCTNDAVRYESPLMPNANSDTRPSLLESGIPFSIQKSRTLPG